MSLSKNTITVLFLFFCSFFYAKAQISLDYFNLLEDKGQVILRWQIAKGNSCNGIHILRSPDNLVYHEVGVIFGICGSQDKAVSFEFRDSFPIINGLNYYKLDLGGNGFSEVKQLELIEFSNKEYQLRYNVHNGSASLLYPNSSNEKWLLSMYSNEGKLVYQQISNSGNIEIDKKKLLPGNYIFKLTQSGSQKTISGNFCQL